MHVTSCMQSTEEIFCEPHSDANQFRPGSLILKHEWTRGAAPVAGVGGRAPHTKKMLVIQQKKNDWLFPWTNFIFYFFFKKTFRHFVCRQTIWSAFCLSKFCLSTFCLFDIMSHNRQIDVPKRHACRSTNTHHRTHWLHYTDFCSK